MIPIVELVGKVAGYAEVIARTTEWMGKEDTQYEVLKLCCGEPGIMSHQVLTMLLRQERLFISRGKPEAITRECRSCSNIRKMTEINRKKYSETNSMDSAPDLGSDLILNKRKGPSEWLKARRMQWDIATRAAHERQIREGVRG